MIPEILIEALGSALPTRVTVAQPVGGGDINHAARIEAGETRYLLKWHASPPPGFFAAEAHGLSVLRVANAIRVPAVVAYAEAVSDGSPGWLLMEWIDTAPAGAKFAENLGHGLAALHRHTQTAYGLDRDNFIGSLPQPNRSTARWVDFYRDQRIGAQMAIARECGMMPPKRQALLEALMSRLDSLIGGVAESPALLHGDLWSGNYLSVGDQPVIIDPAVYFGHREVEIAFTELFGGFPSRFYAAYREAYPLDPGYEWRRALYQLYPLMVHMNLFGGGYALHVDEICRQYL